MMVLRRETYTKPDAADELRRTGRGDRVVAWQDGSLIEFVELYDRETGSLFQATVDPSVNGEASPGEVIEPVFDARCEQVARTTRAGRDLIETRTKLRLVGVKAPSKA